MARYEKPQLVIISELTKAEGMPDCTPGSTNVDECCNGDTVTGECVPGGIVICICNAGPGDIS